MIAHVLLNPFNELKKREKIHFIVFCNKFNKFNYNIGA